jgi:hypothetical protein
VAIVAMEASPAATVAEDPSHSRRLPSLLCGSFVIAAVGMTLELTNTLSAPDRSAVRNTEIRKAWARMVEGRDLLNLILSSTNDSCSNSYFHGMLNEAGAGRC